MSGAMNQAFDQLGMTEEQRRMIALAPRSTPIPGSQSQEFLQGQGGLRGVYEQAQPIMTQNALDQRQQLQQQRLGATGGESGPWWNAFTQQAGTAAASGVPAPTREGVGQPLSTAAKTQFGKMTIPPPSSQQRGAMNYRRGVR
jgi:uncharacterized protein YmfQ (DUF2313 family)